MAFLSEKDRQFVVNLFENLKDPVNIILFTQQKDCRYCGETKQMLEEVRTLSDLITLKVYDFQTDTEAVKTYNIDKVPATVIEGGQDYGIRFYGIPSGYEFSSFLEDIVDVSKRESGLSEDSKTELSKINRPMRLQVFVTPTCPYCPKVVRLAHKLAMENIHITADMVESTEFPHLSMKYNVKGVPRTLVGEDVPIEGAVSEAILVEKVVEAFEKL